MLASQFSRLLLLVACAASASITSSVPGFHRRIVGGYPINITDAPWQISLQISGYHNCGGSIISDQWIITAAHCVGSILDDPEYGKIRAGSTFDMEGGDLYNIKQTIRHPRHNSMPNDFDFALIELEEPLKFDETKKPIKLHDFDETINDNQMSSITGWGNTLNPDESDSQLREVKIPLVNHQKCVEAYSDFFIQITPRMICAGIDEGGKDSCQGDSGGPLVVNSTVDGQPILVGLVSWANGCGEPNYPGANSRVLAAREWIRDQSGI